ncbi:MAG: creatininase family protein [Candidatus Latescibacteria bacterium]|nr:creatininase family protein [Candidatus Latescibacterota bacterium]
MGERNVMVGKFTRREFRQATEEGRFKAAIVATGATEQHLEHLPMEHDIATCQHVAQEAALSLYPQVVVAVPTIVGISEHHMIHPGSLTAKPGSWLALIFDVVESFVRHGIHNVLVLNGHGGNEAPMAGILRQWQLYFRSQDENINVQFHSYWNLSRHISEKHCEGRIPGHAQEYETALAMALMPEAIRRDAMADQEDQEPLRATVEQGEIMLEAAIAESSRYVEEMIGGQHRDMQPGILSRDLDMRA